MKSARRRRRRPGRGARDDEADPGRLGGDPRRDTAAARRVRDRLGSHLQEAGREARNKLSMFSTKKLVNGDSQRLTNNIVQREVNGGLCACQYAPALEILRAIHLLPKCADVHCVATEQERLVVLHGTTNRESPIAANARLAPAVQTLVGLHFDHEERFEVALDASDQ